MKLSALVSVVALLGATAEAAPRGSLRRRGARDRYTSPALRNDKVSHASASDSTVSYSENWAGAVLQSPPADTTYTAVTAQVTAPTVSVPSDATSGSTYSGSAWVGIDGDTYSTAILQTGFDWEVTTDGTVTYTAWYEWYPDYSYDYSDDITISAGDVINMTVTAKSSTEGSAIIENITTGKSVSNDALDAPSSEYPLGGQNAEWIVEDFSSGSDLVPFANFTSVTFTGCAATLSNGTSIGISYNVSELGIEADNVILTDIDLVSDTELVVTYADSDSSASSVSSASTSTGSTATATSSASTTTAASTSTGSTASASTSTASTISSTVSSTATSTSTSGHGSGSGHGHGSGSKGPGGSSESGFWGFRLK